MERLSDVQLGGIKLSRLSSGDVEARVLDHASSPSGRPLVVVSVNLDHIFKFGLTDCLDPTAFDVVYVADGSPVALAASLLERVRWPRATGSAYIAGVVRGAAASGIRVAIIGSSPEVHDALGRRWDIECAPAPRPLFFAPSAEELKDPIYNERLLADLRAARVGVALIALGKPKQEDWIGAFGRDSGVGVLLPLGAGADFWAGAIPRAPSWIQTIGMEWAYRLLREPRRLWRRYLVEGPTALVTLVSETVRPRRLMGRRPGTRPS